MPARLTVRQALGRLRRHSALSSDTVLGILSHGSLALGLLAVYAVFSFLDAREAMSRLSDARREVLGDEDRFSGGEAEIDDELRRRLEALGYL